MDLLDEKEKLGSRVNTIIIGLASLCQQCLVTGKALWDGAICWKIGEMEFKIRLWETLRLRSSKPTQQLGRQAWMRTEADCCSENLLSSWFMAKIPPLGKEGLLWIMPATKRCGELLQGLGAQGVGPRVAQFRSWAQGARTGAGYTGIFEQVQFLNNSLQQVSKAI